MRNLLFFVLLIALNVNAQQSLIIETYGHYNSTGLRRQVPDAFFYGGTIDTSVISQSLAKLAVRNSFGLQMGGTVQYISPWKLSKNTQKWASSYKLILGAGAYQYAGVQFSKDIFGLVFNGGLPYIGDTLNFSNLKVQATTFSKLGFGLYDTLSKSSFLIHFVAVQNHFSGFLTDGLWYQDPNSAQIDLVLNGAAQMSNNQAKAYGVALDLDYRFGSSEDNEAEQQFQLLIQNLGVAKSANATQYELNGTLQYAGFNFNEWQQTNLNTLTNTLLDTLGFVKKNTQSWLILPAQISLSKCLDWDKIQKLQAYYGAQFVLRQTFTPLVYTGAQLKVNKVWYTGLGLVYGGFGGLRAQAYSALRFKNATFLLRSDNITLQSGASLYLQFRCDF